MFDGITGTRHPEEGAKRPSRRMHGADPVGLIVSPAERQQALSALLAAVMALFVASGYPPLARWRRRLRAAAIIVFLVALAAALAEVGFWLAGAQP
jgi:hypothetical protein